MAKKLYVGNLSYNTHEEDLREAFSKIGEVLSATLIVDQTNGRSKGFGFVEMANSAGRSCPPWRASTRCRGRGRALRVRRRRWQRR